MKARERRKLRRELLQNAFTAIREGKTVDEWVAEEQEVRGKDGAVEWMVILELIMTLLPILLDLFNRD